MDETQAELDHQGLVNRLTSWTDDKASWGVTPWGDRIVVHLTVKGVTRSAVAETMEEAFAKACKYFNVT